MNKKVYILHTVKWFADLMRKKLCLPGNLKRPQWHSCDFAYIREGLDCEVNELNHAMETIDVLPYQQFPTKPMLQKAMNEAVDVANYAMMIADYYREVMKEVEG